MRSNGGWLTVAGTALLLAGGTLGAQRPAAMPMMDCPMMSAMMNGPSAALGAGAALKLTAAQRTRLEASQRQFESASKPSMDSMQAIHAQLMALVQQKTLDENAAPGSKTKTSADTPARAARISFETRSQSSPP